MAAQSYHTLSTGRQGCWSLLRRGGFTLVELLVVVLIIGILAAIALPRFLGQRTRAKNAAAQAAVRHALLAARSYYTQSGGDYIGLGPAELRGYESSLSGTEPADNQAPGSSANPQDIWIGNGAGGTNPNTVANGDANAGKTVVLCSASRGDTVYCVKDVDGVATYLALTASTIAAAGASSSGWSTNAWLSSGSSSSITAPVSGHPFRYWKQISFNTASSGAATSTTVSNFPVLIRINSTTWPDATQRSHLFTDSSARRVQFFAPDGTNLPYEVGKFDAAGGEALYWVRVPSLAANANSDSIWMAYGNDPNGADQEQKASTWSQNYNHVWHMGDLGWGGSNPKMLDSRGSANGTESATLSVRSGAVGEGRDFTASPYVSIPDASTLTPTYPTYFFSFATDDLAVNRMILSKDYAGTNQRQVQIGLQPSGGLWAYIWNTAHVYTSTNYSVSTGTTYRGAYSFDGTNARLYVNGVLQSTSATYAGGTGMETTTGGNMNLGRYTYNPPGDGRLFDGMIDEVYIVNGVRDADWIKLDYWSIAKQTSTAGDWLTWSSEQLNPAA